MPSLRKIVRPVACTALLVVAMLSLGGCEGNVGVGVSVGVPVGNYGYVSVGSSRWY